MGNKHGNRTNQIQEYWKLSIKKTPLSISRDGRYITKLFKSYDTNNSGALEKEEAKAYIQDLLRVTHLRKRILDEAKQNQRDPVTYYQEVIEQIFLEMDINKNGSIEFEEIKMPHQENWNEILNLASHQVLRAKEQKNQSLLSGATNLAESNQSLNSDEKGTKTPPLKKTVRPHLKNNKNAQSKSDRNRAVRQSRIGGDDDFEEGDQSDDGLLLEADDLDPDMAYGDSDGEENRQILEVMSESVLLGYQQKIACKVADTIGITIPVARVLLNACQWDHNVVMSRFFEDQEALYNQTGLAPNLSQDVSDYVEPPDPNSEFECSVCLDTKIGYITLPECGHYFCKDCWNESLTDSIKLGQVYQLKCMHQGCSEFVPDEIVKKIVSKEVYARFEEFLAKKFVDMNTRMRWCISPGCGKVVSEPMLEGSAQVGKCSCGAVFCWNLRCSAFAHSPATCKDWEKWEEQINSDELQAKKWVLENTKKCNKCNNRIEKTGGCFMMTCRCGQQFCWLCGKDWSTHTNHFQCSTHPEAGRPEQIGNKVLYLQGVQWDTDELKIKLIERYKFYEDQEKEAKNKEPNISKTIDSLKEKQLIRYTKPASDAAAQLRECRRVIRGMIVMRFSLADTTVNIATAQAQTIELIIEQLANKHEVELINLEKNSQLTFQEVKVFFDDLSRLTKVASSLIRNLLLQGD